MEKPKFIIFFIISLIVYLIYKFNKKIDRDSLEREKNMKKGKGKITRINQDDRGDTWFYIEFNIDGKMYEAQTSSYIKTPKDTCKSDTVEIEYYFTKNGKDARCRITQEGFESVINYDKSSNDLNKYTLITSIGFLILGIIGAISYLIK